MQIDGWKYYNHAAIPTCAPHEAPDLEPIGNRSIWSLKKGTFLARWTTDFDCNEETNWWYVIKDVPFDISQLKAKRRYEITKGNNNFEVKEIVPLQYVEELYNIVEAAYATYPSKYRPELTHEKFYNDVAGWNFYKVYGAFNKDSGQLCGYSILQKEKRYIDFCVQKVIPECEKMAINASLVYKILMDQECFLRNGGYICDGSRNINHETAFQDYLEKYFMFRKAYCQLNVEYKKPLKLLVKILYPFRKVLLVFDFIGCVHQMNVILKMESLVREQR